MGECGSSPKWVWAAPSTSPCRSSATGAEVVPARATRSDGRRSVIVIVDDDRASLELLSAYLAGTGLQVVRARDGLEGLEEIRRDGPAAVMLDIRLPGMDGWEVLRRCAADDATRDIPVIIVSILDEKSRGLALGAAGYLIKPVKPGRTDRGRCVARRV